jgi:nucleoid DNA-binding protein
MIYTSQILIAEIAKRSALTTEQAKNALDAVIQSFSDALEKKDEIRIQGFGTFLVSLQKARTARNPQTGNPIAIAEKYVPRFRPSKNLRERVAGEKETENTIDDEAN